MKMKPKVSHVILLIQAAFYGALFMTLVIDPPFLGGINSLTRGLAVIIVGALLMWTLYRWTDEGVTMWEREADTKRPLRPDEDEESDAAQDFYDTWSRRR